MNKSFTKYKKTLDQIASQPVSPPASFTQRQLILNIVVVMEIHCFQASRQRTANRQPPIIYAQWPPAKRKAVKKGEGGRGGREGGGSGGAGDGCQRRKRQRGAHGCRSPVGRVTTRRTRAHQTERMEARGRGWHRGRGQDGGERRSRNVVV